MVNLLDSPNASYSAVDLARRRAVLARKLAHPQPADIHTALPKLRERLLHQKTWRYLRYLHLRDSLMDVSDDIETVVIVGAGHGIAEIALALEFPHIHFTLTDAQMDGYPIYHDAMHIAWAWGIDNVAFSVWNVLEPTQRRFDLVASTEVLEHIEDADGAAEQMRATARKYVYCLVPFATDADNANTARRARALDKFGHFYVGYTRAMLEARFPDPLHIKGAYFHDAGQVLRQRLTAASRKTISAQRKALFTLGEKDLRDELPTSMADGQGIRILSRV